MSKISEKNTKPEILVRKFLFSKGFRYRINVKTLPGKPDIVLPKYKTVIFINGCFWHGYNCKKGKLPSSNIDFWKEKISNNKSRDDKNFDLLVKLGWKVIIIWRCEISKIDNRIKYLISYWKISNSNNHETLNLKYKCINRENI
jgi:DNA mismatch endonuclease (patch repair protein)